MSVVLSPVRCVTLLYALCFIVIIKLNREMRRRVQKMEGLEKEGVKKRLLIVLANLRNI